MAIPLEGIFPALWTPTNENGELLAEEFKSNLEFILNSGAHGSMALGSTGEFIHLRTPERKKILEKVVELSGNKPVIANISHIRPADVFDLGRHARAAGAYAVALLPPWFYPLSPDDLAEFYARAGQAAQLPMVLYNFPELTGKKLELETIRRIDDLFPIAGIKQSGAEFGYHAPLVQLGRERDFVVLTGYDTRIAEAMEIGVTGCIGGLGNVAPELMAEIFSAVAAGVPARAALATERMAELGRRIGGITFPLNIAAAMEARGLKPGVPKAVVSAETRKQCRQLTGELRELFQEWKLSVF